MKNSMTHTNLKYIDGRSFWGSESDFLGQPLIGQGLLFSVTAPSKNVFLLPMLQILSTSLEKLPFKG